MESFCFYVHNAVNAIFSAFASAVHVNFAKTVKDNAFWEFMLQKGGIL
jgi:hypothetical protein